MVAYEAMDIRMYGINHVLSGNQMIHSESTFFEIGRRHSMKRELDITIKDEVLTLGADLVYMQRPYWCNAGFYPLKMSLIRPRNFFAYDRQRDPMPVIVWLCGGGWTEVDHNVWIPELTYFARRVIWWLAYLIV